MIADRFSERWDAVDPWDQRYPHLWVKVEHLGRYLFAANYLKSAGARTIADIASGTGYGARELASDSRQVFAIDGDPELVEMARTGPEPQTSNSTTVYSGGSHSPWSSRSISNSTQSSVSRLSST